MAPERVAIRVALGPTLQLPFGPTPGGAGHAAAPSARASRFDGAQSNPVEPL
jgi:hypothetical protein